MKQYIILIMLTVIVFIGIDAQIIEEGHVLDGGSIDVLETYVKYDRASVACGYDGLYFYDLTDPVNPVLIFNYATNRALDCAHDSAFVYIADASGGFVILNYSDTSNIHTAAVMNDSITGARRITLKNNYAYIADGNNGMHIVDITDGYNPQHIGHYSISAGSARKVQVNNGSAYIACQTAGVDIIDINDKSNPIFIGNIPALYLNDDICLDNNYLYIADSDSGMTIYDVSNPGSPIFINRIVTGNSSLRILKLYDYLYIAAFGYLEMIDVSSVFSLSLFDDIQAYYAKGIGLSDDGYIYVAEGTSGLGIYSTSM
ncbi:MAG: hypothetical protein SVK54_00890, partial [candidate division WOR-3 bacterium]|nr:hypothetical protein [candidate division WOR-3 bacterium]